MKILAIDPSINHIGLAYRRSDAERVQWSQINPPQSRGEWKSDLRERVDLILAKIRVLSLYDTNVGIIEYPAFQNSTRGHIAAQMGYTLDLAYICGAVVASMPNTKWYLPTPQQWKGQQPKMAIGIKFTRWTGVDYNTVSDHCYEAAMMIKWYLDSVAKWKI